MTLRRKPLLIGGAILFGTAVVICYAAAFWLFSPGHPQSQGEKVTVGKNKAWVEQYFQNTFSAIQREGRGVRVDARQGDVYYLRRGVKSNSSESEHGKSVVLYPGDTMGNVHQHGGQNYTIRMVLLDKVVIDYMVYHYGMGGDGTDTGTVELAYRN